MKRIVLVILILLNFPTIYANAKNDELLKEVWRYHDSRLQNQQNQLEKLIKITAEAINSYQGDDLKKKVIKALQEDIDRIKNINILAKDNALSAEELNERVMVTLIQKDIKERSIEHTNFSDKPALSFPFLHNKLLDLFNGATKLIDKHWAAIQAGNSTELLNDSKNISWEGTSVLNYLQTALLETLSVIP